MAFDITPHKLPDEAFWQSGQRGGDPLAREPVGEFHGLIVDAPARVLLGERSTLPGAVYHHGAIREMAFVDFTRLGLVLAIDVDRNRLYWAAGVRLVLDDDPEASEPVDVDALPQGDMSTTHGVELRSVLNLPWAPAGLLVSAQLRGVVSNRVRVELVGGTDPTAEPTDAGPRPVSAAADTAEVSADLPAGAGLVVGLPRVVDPRAERYWPLSIQYAVAESPGPVRIHVLVLGADDGGIEHLLIEPESPECRDGLARGACVIDLARQLVSRRAQTYFVTALCGPLMSIPVPSALLPVSD